MGFCPRNAVIPVTWGILVRVSGYDAGMLEEPGHEAGARTYREREDSRARNQQARVGEKGGLVSLVATTVNTLFPRTPLFRARIYPRMSIGGQSQSRRDRSWRWIDRERKRERNESSLLARALQALPGQRPIPYVWPKVEFTPGRQYGPRPMKIPLENSPWSEFYFSDRLHTEPNDGNER